MRTTGNITGVNTGDSKLLALKINLQSDRGSVTARRMRSDDIHLKGSRVQITSSIEASKLSCEAGPGGFIVNKRVGIGKTGKIDSAGHIKIGSVFSMMRELPPVAENTDTDDLSKETFTKGLEQAIKEQETAGLVMTAEEDIAIDNLQGVVSIHATKPSKIHLRTVESAKLVVDAPLSDVILNLKTIHDLSHINCNSAEITIGENFKACEIYD